MKLMNISADPTRAQEEVTRATVTNAVAICTGSLENLIGKELASSSDIDLEQYLAVCIGDELDKARGV